MLEHYLHPRFIIANTLHKGISSMDVQITL